MTASAAPRCAIPDTPLADAAAGLDACVHCGFCMQACPTYLALGDENDSPRGRLVLMRSLLEGDVAASDPALATHIDQCLGCRACESACPSGVPYGALLEATRATLNTRSGKDLPTVARLILRVFASPSLLALAMLFARLARALGIAAMFARLPGRVGFASAMLASTPRSARRSYALGDGTRGSVALLNGCVMEGLFAATNRATERVLAANGYRLTRVRGQGCCGALHAHAGDLEGARALARTNIAAFEQALPDHIAVNAAGCGAMLKEYAHLLQDDPTWHARATQVAARARDVSELLAAAGPRRAKGTLRPLRVAYDPPCHLLHAQRVSAPPIATLGAATGVELVPLADADQCCGGAGIYNLQHADVSQSVLNAKLDRIEEARVSVVATGNPGCLMQIGAGLLRRRSRVRVAHPVDLLDAAYAAPPPVANTHVPR